MSPKSKKKQGSKQEEGNTDNESVNSALSSYPNPFGFEQRYVDCFGEYLSKRNFYIIHKHHATAKHYDLRLQCSGVHGYGVYCDTCDCTHEKGGEDSLISFAIPKGLSGMDSKTKRLGIETPLHPVSYAVHEGKGVGITGLWDVGTYHVVKHEESSQKIDTQEDEKKVEGYDDEDKLRQVYQSNDNPNRPKKRKTNDRESNSTNTNTKKKTWFIGLAGKGPQEKQNFENDIGDRSVLSSMTMEEIEKHYPEIDQEVCKE